MLDPEMIRQLQGALSEASVNKGMGVATPNAQGGMYDELFALLSQYGGAPAPQYKAYGDNVDPNIWNVSKFPAPPMGADIDPGFNRQPSLAPNVAPSQGLPKPIVGQPVPGIPDQSRQPTQRPSQLAEEPRDNWLQGNGQPRIPVVHDRTGASADTLSRGQKMRFDNIRNLYGGEQAAAARDNMLEHNARRPVIPTAPPAPVVPPPPPGSFEVPTVTVPAATPTAPDPVQAAMRRARAIMARPEIPRVRRR